MNELIKVDQQEALAEQAVISVDIYEYFLTSLKGTAKPRTIDTYRKALKQMRAFLESRSIMQPVRGDMITFLEDLRATGHKPATVTAYLAAAKAFFKWAETERIYPNIANGIKGATLDRAHKKDYLTSRQIKTVLAGIDRYTLQGKRDFAMLAAMVTCGLRTIEVSRANIGDIRTAADNVVLYVQGKGRDERTEYVKLDAQVESFIREYLKARGESNPEAPLFASLSHNSMGQRMTTRAISGIAKQAMCDAGYNSDRLTAHSLRHSAVTLALLNGRPLDEVQQFARHRDISTTMIYNHAIEQAKNQCSEVISKAIF